MEKEELKLFTEEFSKLPLRARELFFEKCFRDEDNLIDYIAGNIVEYPGNPTMYDICSFVDDIFSDCESPIETILGFAFALKHDGYYLIPQLEVKHDGKTYRCDFVFDTDLYKAQRRINGTDLKLAIECDGFDYHSSKFQVKHDNEKDLALKMEGYEVLHYSGSQIYADPFKCHDEIMEFVEKKLGDGTNGRS